MTTVTYPVAPNVPKPKVPGSDMTMAEYFRAERQIRENRRHLPDDAAVLTVGRALRQIRDGEGWRMYKHQSWESYLAQDWKMTEAEAEKLITMAIILDAEAGMCPQPEDIECPDCPAQDVCTFDSLNPAPTPPATVISQSIISQEDPMNSQPRNTQINLSSITPSRWQPRQAFDAAELLTLADSIRRHGLLVPITVFARPEGGYELIAGERRVRASVAWAATASDIEPNGLDLKGWVGVVARDDFWSSLEANHLRILDRIAGQMVDAKVLPGDDLAGLQELVLVETLQRVDLTPLERAQAVQALMVAHEYTQTQVAKRLGVSQPTVSQWLSLLDVAPAVQAAIIDRSISPSAAQAIAQVPAPAQEAVTRRALQMGAQADDPATKRQVQKLAKTVREFLDPERYVVPADLVVDPPRRNLLRLLQHVVAHLPEERVDAVVEQLTGEYDIRVLRRDPLKLDGWDATKILQALRDSKADRQSSHWGAVATQEGWTCGTCQLRLLENLQPSDEGLDPYCRRCRWPEDQPETEIVTCDRYVGPHDPLVIPLDWRGREHWRPDLLEQIPQADGVGVYVDDIQDYRGGYQLACAAAARAAQEKAQAHRRAHLADMEAYQRLLLNPLVDVDHFQAHSCARCTHFNLEEGYENIPCRYAAEPLKSQYSDQARAPEYGLLVRRDGLLVPRCEMFRWREVPELVNGSRGSRGWRFLDRDLALDLLDALWHTGEYRTVLEHYGVLSWLPYPRARSKSGDADRLVTYVRAEWDALGGDDAVANLLALALAENRAVGRRGAAELATPAGEVEEWAAIGLKNLQNGTVPYNYPDDWPTPWRAAEAEESGDG